MNVRDFAWNDLQAADLGCPGREINERVVVAQSGYTKEECPSGTSTALPRWRIRCGLRRYTFDYPYPRRQLHGPVARRGDGIPDALLQRTQAREGPAPTASARKLGLVGVIIHEVGHNFFPMIVNVMSANGPGWTRASNTFLQHLAEREWRIPPSPAPRASPSASSTI